MDVKHHVSFKHSLSAGVKGLVYKSFGRGGGRYSLLYRCFCCQQRWCSALCTHTPSIAFRHLPPNFARFSYATEGALFISAKLSTDAVSALRKVRVLIKLQALVYDILPSTTAVFSYAKGPRNLPANEQFFAGAQTVVSLLQTTPIISDVYFITDHVAYASSNKTKIV